MKTYEPKVGDEIVINGVYLGEITHLLNGYARVRWTGPVWLGQRDTEYSINLGRAAWEPA